MLMTNENIRLFPHDRLLGATVVKLIPQWVEPNHVTVLRFFLIPIILILILNEEWRYALPLFLLTAFTDALDGTLARLRNKITMWGTIADPIADKLLIGLVAIILVSQFLSPAFAALIVALELLIVAGAAYRGRKGVHTSANNWGKSKMFLQVVGVSCLLLAPIIGQTMTVPAAGAALALALPIGIVSFLTYSL